MYLKLTGNLIDLLGDAARRDIKTECGLLVRPEYQSFLGPEVITLAEVVDQEKCAYLLDDPRVEVLETDEDFNAAIDAHFEDRYTLTDSTALLLSLQLSGKMAADIPGYDTQKSMEDPGNLQALYNAGMSGIKLRPKPPKKEVE